MAGDAGRNSETAILYEDFLRDYEGPLTMTRDAVDLIKKRLPANRRASEHAACRVLCADTKAIPKRVLSKNFDI